MKTDILRLASIGKYGVGGPETGAIGLIYTYLLQEMHLDFYNLIIINQVEDYSDELVMTTGKKVADINIMYHTDEQYETKSIDEKKLIRLDIIHAALLRLSDKDKRFEKDKLEVIRNKIIENDFSFDIVYKTFINPKNNNLSAKVIINPEEYQFNFYVLIEERGIEKCRVLIYSGKTTDHYIPGLFLYGKWKGIEEFILSGKEKDVETQIVIDKCQVNVINRTGFDKHPFYEMMKANAILSESERKKAYQNWLQTLPPGMADLLDNEV